MTARLGRAGIEVQSFDTGSTVAQARQTFRGVDLSRTDMLLGPLYSGQIADLRSVSPASIPILSLSNDTASAQRNVFIMGVTPEQKTRAVLRYARRQGVRRIAMLPGDSPWSTAVIREASRVAISYGLTLHEMPSQSHSSIENAEAVLFTGHQHGQFAETLEICRRQGQQVLGAGNWTDLPEDISRQLEGAWFASAGLTNSLPYQQNTLSQMTILSAIAEDAASLAVQRLSPATPTAIAGEFSGRLGNYEILSDGRVLRDMSILTFSAGQPDVIASVGFQAGNV